MKNKMLISAVIFSTFLAIFSVNAMAQVASFRALDQAANLQTISGQNFDLSDARGKVVVLAIGASWLPLTKQQIITTNRLVRQYSAGNVMIYWVTTESINPKSKNFASIQEIQAFAAKNKLTAPILRDPDGLFTLKKFGVDQLPSFVILNKEGKSVGEPFGGLDPDNESEIFVQVARAIDKAL